VDAASGHNAVTLFDTATQKETRIAASLGIAYWAELTPDDQRVLIVSRPFGGEAALAAWDVNTQKQLWQQPVERGADQDGGGLPYAISPDGSAIAAGGFRGQLQVFEMRDGSQRFSIKSTEEIPMSVAFSPDNSTIATSAGYSDSVIRLWDAHTGKAIGSLEGHRGWVSGLVFTPDGKLLISSAADQTIRLWDWATVKPAGVLRGHLAEVDGLALAPDGQTLASRCKDGSIYQWDVKQPSRHSGYQILPVRMDAYGSALTLDSRSIMAVMAVRPGDTLVQCDLDTLQTNRQTWGNATNRSDDFHFSPDGRWMVWKSPPGHLNVWDIRNGVESTNFVAGPHDLNGCDFTENGKFFVTLHGPATDRVLETWDPNTWHRISSRLIHFNDPKNSGNDFSFPSSYVIAADGAFNIFDVSNPDRAPKQIRQISPDYNDFQVSPDGRFAAASYNNSGIIRLWDIASGRLVDSFTGFLLSPSALTFSPDSRRLAVTSVGKEAVKLWDVENRQEVLTMSGEGAVFRMLKFSPDGRHLLGINSFSFVHLWSAPSWEEIAAAETKEKAGIRQP
jgi:WD40 repeat protein